MTGSRSIIDSHQQPLGNADTDEGNKLHLPWQLSHSVLSTPPTPAVSVTLILLILKHKPWPHELVLDDEALEGLCA